MIRTWLVAAFLVAGCQPSGDLCFGHDGSCIGLTVFGPPGARIDTLAITVDGVGPTLSARHQGPTVSLPVTTALYLPDDARGTDLVVRVDGYLGAPAIHVGSGQGGASGSFGGGTHANVTVYLAADGPPDAGVDGGDAALRSDGGAADAAAVDSARPDLARSPPDACGVPAGFFCDDFEIDDNTRWPGPKTLQGAVTLGVDPSDHYSGSRSLHAKAFNLASTGAAYETSAQFPNSYVSGILSARFFVRAAANYKARNELLRFGPDIALAVGLTDFDGQLDVIFGNTDHSNGSTLTANAWRCLELVLDLDAHTFALYVADPLTFKLADPPALTGTGVPAMAISSLDFGLTWIIDHSNEDFWFDDLIVATQRIGCQ